MECYNSTHYWPRQKIDPRRLDDYKNFFTLVFLLSSHWVRRFFTNQSVVLPSPKRPCLFTSDSSTNDGLTRDSLTRDSLTHDGPDPRRFDLRRLGPAAPDGSAAGHLTASATKPRNSKPRGSSLGSVFLLSSHWFRRFFINQCCRFFPLFDICFKGFFHLSLVRFSSSVLTG